MYEKYIKVVLELKTKVLTIVSPSLSCSKHLGTWHYKPCLSLYLTDILWTFWVKVIIAFTLNIVYNCNKQKKTCYTYILLYIVSLTSVNENNTISRRNTFCITVKVVHVYHDTIITIFNQRKSLIENLLYQQAKTFGTDIKSEFKHNFAKNDTRTKCLPRRKTTTTHKNIIDFTSNSLN